jgi:hypothetical protein
MVTNPRKDEPVARPCIKCHRDPRPGETYGPHAEGWDFLGICPGCWDEITAEDDEERAEEELERRAEEESLERKEERLAEDEALERRRLPGAGPQIAKPPGRRTRGLAERTR